MKNQIAKKDYHLYKEYLTQDNALIIKDFESIINNQKKDNSFETYTLETFSVNIFQDIYSNQMQNSAYTPYHSHNFYEMNYIHSGTCHEYVSQKLLNLKKGDLLIMSPGIMHSCYLTPHSKGTNFCFRKKHFDTLDTSSFVSPNKNFLSDIKTSSAYYLFHTKDSQLLSSLLQELYEYSYKAINFGTSDYLRATKLVNLIMFELQYALIEKKIEYQTNSSLFKVSNDVFSEITKYMSNNISTITREKVEKHFGISAMTLFRIMKENGTTYKEYITTLRQREAVYLLKHTKLNIKEISERLGFKSSEYFGRFFKNYRNMSPTDYREKYLSTGAIDSINNI